jgi:lipopolysaccharide transport system permease protein
MTKTEPQTPEIRPMENARPSGQVRRRSRIGRIEGFTYQRWLDLTLILAMRALKVRYRGSILGIYWSLSNPLLMTVVYTAIFGTAFSSYYNNSIINYVLACFVGLTVLTYFSAATGQSLPSVVGNGSLLNKIKLPFSIFPCATIAANTFQFSVGTLPLLAVITAFNSHSVVNVVSLLAPTVALALVACGVSFITSSLFVFFRDLPYIYDLIVFVIYMSSPTFYPAALVPVSVKPLIALNPIASIIECFRQIALSGQPPALHLLAISLATGLSFFAIGVSIFAFLKSEFMDLL